MTPAQLYADVRVRMTDLVRDLPDDRAATTVPGCPTWTVHDLVAHCAGLVTDVLEGRFDGAGEDHWTAAQVAARKDVPIPDLLTEWSEGAATFEPRLDEFPKAIWKTVVVDLVTHEHDLRGALGTPGARDTEAVALATKSYAVGLAKTIEAQGLPGLRLEAPDWTFDAGPEPATTVRVKESFELFRALSGRRGRAQVLAYDWSGDPAPYLPVLNRFGALPETDVVE
ncbi:MAG TPA: maleylpyruvate isomerase family mycothiol-dependent enzyme [Mycobacteriales bacterium]|jgi:uncharacterized protein (TIGR03083 family)|nr:maleylpyruvate isomerase family mycothiol-dependent enzyme [Mycobacteriales bacterium]